MLQHFFTLVVVGTIQCVTWFVWVPVAFHEIKIKKMYKKYFRPCPYFFATLQPEEREFLGVTQKWCLLFRPRKPLYDDDDDDDDDVGE